MENKNKQLGSILMVAGAAVVIAGNLLFRNLHYVNAVDSHAWTININGIRSFPWPDFIGYSTLISGLCCMVAPMPEKGHRFD